MVRNEEEKFARSYSDRAQGIISKANILHRTVTGTKIYILVERYSEAWEYNSSDWKEPETGCQVTKLTAENFDTRFPALGKKSTRKYLGFPPPRPAPPSTTPSAAIAPSTPPSASQLSQSTKVVKPPCRKSKRLIRRSRPS